MRSTGIARPAAAARHEAALRPARITGAGLSWLEQLAVENAAPDNMIDRLRRNLQARSQALEDHDGSLGADGSDTPHAYTGLRRGLLGAQRDELTRLHADGEIGEGEAGASGDSSTSKRQGSATARRARSQDAKKDKGPERPRTALRPAAPAPA